MASDADDGGNDDNGEWRNSGDDDDDDDNDNDNDDDDGDGE